MFLAVHGTLKELLRWNDDVRKLKEDRKVDGTRGFLYATLMKSGIGKIYMRKPFLMEKA